MPLTTVLFLAAIVGMFATFIVVVGGVSIWTYLPERRAAHRLETPRWRAASQY